jgi:hypothetical protein
MSFLRYLRPAIALGSIATVVLVGAGVGHGQARHSGAVPTFAKDIAPILQRSCQNCHRPQGVGPMPLVTYEQTRPWARSIQLKTAKGEMPPWFIEKNVGIQKFKDDPSLGDEEIATITAWADNGAPQGNPADMPPPKQFPPVGAWSLGTPPDLIVSSPTWTVRSVGGDTYPDIGSTPTGLREDRWIKSFEVREFRPEEQKMERTTGAVSGDLNYFTVHHSGISARSAEDEENPGGGAAQVPCQFERVCTELPRSNFSYVFNVGMNAYTYPDELGIRLAAGSSIFFPSNHLHSIGREVKVQVQVAFWFHPKGFEPKYARGIARSPGFARLTEIDIPAGMDNVRQDSFTTLKQPARMVNFEPHLHASGKRMCIEAVYPTGVHEMLNCAGYNHNWVKAYVYDDDVAPLLPAGTILHLIGWYDNSAKNPRNPDPRNWKGYGQRSVDDMFQTSSMFVYFTDEEFKAEVAAREAKQHLKTNTTAQHQ